MAQSSIEWTNKVWNPTTGCHKISQGCKNCYAEKMHKRLTAMGQKKYKRPFLAGAFPDEPSLYAPLKWKKPAMIFVNSMSDLFHESVPDEFIIRVLAVMYVCDQHTFQVLTKRADRLPKFFSDPKLPGRIDDAVGRLMSETSGISSKICIQQNGYLENWPLKNLWLGVSVENQDTAMERIPQLMETPAAIRWLSMEPLLEMVHFRDIRVADKLDWIVVGGESGPKKRPFNVDWARYVRDYCKVQGIKFFMKQIDKVQEIPSTLMIREYPTV